MSSYFPIIKRYIAQNATKIKNARKMKAWSIHSYGDLSELQLTDTRIPIIQSPDEVLVQVSAASVNPIDILMLGGYGRTLFQIPRNYELEFPLTMGRDFAGTVIAKGHDVNSVEIGDEVYGFVPLHKQGAFSEAVIADQCHVLPKPKHLDFESSASLVYATMTAWSSLYIMGNLCTRQTKGLRVLVLGGSGGVGGSAIQLLKSQGCVVFSTCSTDAVPLVKSLGADIVYDRCDPDFNKTVALEGKYHVILDCCKMGIQNIPDDWSYETYITLNSPLLLNTDQYGLAGGLLYSANNFLGANVNRISSGKTVRWGFFLPSNNGFRFVDELIREDKIKPTIHKKFSFEELPLAFKSVQDGHLRGKVVVSNK